MEWIKQNVVKELRDSWIDILVILSDNKGHPLWELAEKVQREKSNLYLTLELLEAGRPEGPWNYGFNWYEFRDLAEFTVKLHEAKDSLSCLILEKTNSLFGQRQDPDRDPYFVLESINYLLDDADVHNKSSFSNNEISTSIRELANKDLSWPDLRNLNRLIFEEAYRDDIYGTQNSIIYRGTARKTTNPKSRHPRVTEVPYYINQDIYVFSFILINMDKLLDNAPLLKDTDPKEEIKIPDQAQDFFRQKANQEIIELQDEMEDESLVQLKKELDRHFGRFNKFIYSNYTYSMIMKFGFKAIREIIKPKIYDVPLFFMTKRLLADNLLKKQDDIETAKEILDELYLVDDDN